ncbi:MAG: PDZ domain-containing protein [Bacillota bacterium]|nr:PDZ domain-containing protein [Bacillota bacterium]
MLTQLLGEFPKRSTTAMNRRVYRLDYGAIGVTFERETLVIREVQVGSPAEQAGLQPGDTIVKVNDTSLPARFTMNWKDLAKKLQPWFAAVAEAKGKSPVKLTVKRPGVKGNLPVTVTPVLVTTYVTYDN